MSLEVLLEPIPDRDVIRRCKVGKFYDGLPEKYQAALDGLMTTLFEQGGLTDQELTDRLKQAGCGASNTVVHMHRKGKCVCTK